ncbi:FHA domain-containing protein [Actinomyces marmotae]|nr:FHA domain-containing protein [Actinomyces marmotae]
MAPDDEGHAPEGRSAGTLAEAERGEVIVGMLGTALLVPGAPERVAAAVLAALGGPVVQGDAGAVKGAAAQAAISTGQEPPDPDEPDRLVAQDEAGDGTEDADPSPGSPAAAVAAGAPTPDGPASAWDAIDGVDDEDLPATGVWVEPEEEDAGPPTAAMPGPAPDPEDDSGSYDLSASFPEPEPGSGRRRHRGSSVPTAGSASVGSPATGPGGEAPAGNAINTLPSSAVAEALATAMVRDARPVLALLRLSTGQDVLVRAGGEVVIGRAPQSASARAALVVVPSTSHMVSRSHVRITTAGSSVLAQDLGSSNGTILHRPGCPAVLIASALPTPLSVGDVLSIGDGMTLRLVAPSAPMGAGPPSPPSIHPFQHYQQ